MTSKNKKKGTKMPLGQFLGTDSKLVTVQAKNWSEIVDDQEAEETKPIVVDLGLLPTAPRGAVDIVIPSEPPFIAHVSNLSFEIDDERLRRIFGDLNPKAARVLKDGGRSRGVGLVEFDKREDLVEALKKNDKEHYGRNIRVAVSDKPELFSNDNNRGFGNNRSNRNNTGEERPEMSGTWKRAEPRSEGPSGGGFNRDRPNRNDFGRSNASGGNGGGSRDNQQGNDYGFGYPRTRDDRGGGGNRDFNRQGQRNRQDDDERSNSGADRPRYGGRYSDNRDTRNQNRGNAEEPRTEPQDPTRERPRLQLQPRSKPLEDVQPLSGSSSSVNNVAANAEQSLTSNPDDSSSSLTNQQNADSPNNENEQESQQGDFHDSAQSTVKPSRGAGASIFGGAKPVDTAARELEIEKKLRETQITSEPSTENEERKSSTRPSYNRGGDRDSNRGGDRDSNRGGDRDSYRGGDRDNNRGGDRDSNRGGDRDSYRAKRSSQTDEYRERRGDGRSSHGGDYHRQENTGGRQYDDEGRRRNDDDQPPRRGSGGGGGGGGGGYSGSSRRDVDSNRGNRFSHPERDNDGGQNRNRNQDTSESSNQGRPSDTDDFTSESQPRHPQRNLARRTLPTEDDSNRLQLSNKFCMLDNEDLDDDNHNENDNDQSPTVEE